MSNKEWSKLSDEEKHKIVQDFLDKTDWNEFWRVCAEKAAPEIEAYRQASARSIGAIV